ncbi:hypothetical protein BC567DRAFT_235646 [Phyllosticta citribraziliensis]
MKHFLFFLVFSLAFFFLSHSLSRLPGTLPDFSRGRPLRMTFIHPSVRQPQSLPFQRKVRRGRQNSTGQNETSSR